jgi:hypothetical protein
MTTDRLDELGAYLRQTSADQGGECTFAEWVDAVASDDEEFAHQEAVEFVALGGDTSEKQEKLPAPITKTRMQDLYRVLDDAHTNLKDEVDGSGWLPSFREWLNAAAVDPYHSLNLESKEYLSLESTSSDERNEH